MDDEYKDEEFQPSDEVSDESFHSDPEDAMEVDEPADDYEEDEKPKRTKKGSTKKAAPKKTVKAGSSLADGPPDTIVGKLRVFAALPRSQARDHSYKQRFLSHYGSDEEFYQQLLSYRNIWQDKIFYVSESQLKDEFEHNPALFSLHPDAPGIFSLVPDIHASKSSGKAGRAVSAYNSPELSITLQLGQLSEPVALKFADFFDLGSIGRKGLFVNVGGHVVSMKWLATAPGDAKAAHCQFLALAVVYSSQNVSSLVNNPAIGFFNGKQSKEDDSPGGGIQIWKYNPKTNEFTLYKNYNTGETLGMPLEISWLPEYSSTDVVGVLGAVTSNGQLHLVKVPATELVAEEELIDASSVVYEIEGEKITCFSYIGNHKLIVGVTNGSIAEFILPNPNEDHTIPSFIQVVTDAPISAISVAQRGNQNDDKVTILVNSVGIQSFAIEYQNFQHGRVEAWAYNSFINPVYNSGLKVFISPDSQDSLSYTFVRHPQEKPSLIMKVDGTITSFHQSEYLNHPLNVVGTSLGEVNVVNMGRKILSSSKPVQRSIQAIRLWKVSQDHDNPNGLSLCGDYVVSALDKTLKSLLAPPETLISAVSWNESIHCSSLLAAATASGVLILERIDPKVS